MSAVEPPPPPRRQPDLEFRTAAAPGLDEDDLFAALYGLPVPGPFWGDGVPPDRPDPDAPWDEDRERRRRHAEVLERWPAGEERSPT